MDLIGRIDLMLRTTGYNVLNKQQIQMIYPELSGYVDLILFHNDFNICVKDYWTWNNITDEIIKTYQTSSINFNTRTDKKFYFILLKKNTSKKNQGYNILDYKNPHSDFLYQIEKNSIEKLLKHFSVLLYSSNIYFYEPDGSTIMLEL
jgi:hypothetical protein